MLTIAILIAAIPAIAVISMVLLLRAGIRREDSDLSLRGEPSTRASAMTRRMVGLYVRVPQHPTQDDGRADARERELPPDHRWPGTNPH